MARPIMWERLDQLISGAQVLRAWDGTNEATWNAQHKPCEPVLRWRGVGRSQQMIIRLGETFIRRSRE